MTDPLALSLPPNITGGQMKGFALAMSKMVMNGGVGEAVQMAKSESAERATSLTVGSARLTYRHPASQTMRGGVVGRLISDVRKWRGV